MQHAVKPEVKPNQNVIDLHIFPHFLPVRSDGAYTQILRRIIEIQTNEALPCRNVQSILRREIFKTDAIGNGISDIQEPSRHVGGQVSVLSFLKIWG